MKKNLDPKRLSLWRNKLNVLDAKSKNDMGLISVHIIDRY